MNNCRPAQIQQRRHDRHMSLDMSSCRRDSGGSYLVSCWNSGLRVPSCLIDVCPLVVFLSDYPKRKSTFRHYHYKLFFDRGVQS